MATLAAPCPEMSRPLHYRPDPALNQVIFSGFADSLLNRLQMPLKNLGYCLGLTKPGKKDSVGGDLGLLVSFRSSESGLQLLATVLAEEQRRAGKTRDALQRPLVEMPWYPEDGNATLSIFAQKLVENLRTQYVAVVGIITQPGGSRVRAQNGLEGKTPLEWVLPLGYLPIEVTRSGYLDRKMELDLRRPGEHTVSLPMIRRRFYHSRLFPVSALAAGTALGAYIMQNYYYSQYNQLGLEDQRNRPERFGQLFNTAKTWESITAGSLGLAVVTLGLTFRF